jgi:thiamine-phosphate pyrophosphorylase
LASHSPAESRWKARRPILCLVVDRAASPRPLSETVAAACAGGVDWLQLRDRELEGADWLRWGEELADAARRHAPEVRILVNRRVDVALAMGADGVHLGFDAMPAADARPLLGQETLIGASTHGVDEVRALSNSPIDYLHLAPIYTPYSKPASRSPLGTKVLAEACRHGMPVIAQGGIDPQRCSAILQAGAAGVAITGTLLAAEDPQKTAEAFRAALDPPV